MFRILNTIIYWAQRIQGINEVMFEFVKLQLAKSNTKLRYNDTSYKHPFLYQLFLLPRSLLTRILCSIVVSIVSMILYSFAKPQILLFILH